MKVLKSDYKYRHSYKKILCKKGVDKKAEMDTLPPPPEFFANKRVSALLLNKKQSLAYQKRHGCRRFQAAASFSSEKLVVGQRTRTYAVQHACGCFLYAPSIYSVYLQKRLLQRASSKSASPICKKAGYIWQTAQLFYNQSTIS